MQQFMKMPMGNGEMTVRFLPGVNKVYVAYRLHTLPIDDGSVKRYTCHRTLQNVNGVSKFTGMCHICDGYNDLWKEYERTKNMALMQRAKYIKPLERYLFNVIEKNHGAYGTVPQILSVGKALFTKFVTNVMGDQSKKVKPLGDVTDRKTGRDFVIVKELVNTNGMQYPSYEKSYFCAPSKVYNKEDWAELLALRHDLTQMVNFEEDHVLATAMKKYLAAPMEPGKLSKYRSLDHEWMT